MMNLRRLPFSLAFSVLVSIGFGQTALSSEAFLRADDPDSQVNVRSQPTTQSQLLHYGLPGDAVQVLEEQRVGAYTWYRVEFPRSKARGWVRGDLIRLASSLGNRGIIQGELSFPSDFLPGQKVCAKNLDTQKVFCIETRQSQRRYSLEVNRGRYHVYTQACNQSYRNPIVCRDGYMKRKAFYNAYVRCGMSAQCARTAGYRPIPIQVSSGGIVTDINPQDWYSR